MIKRDYVDQHGIQRRVWVRHEHDDPREGIPCSLMIEGLLDRGVSQEFIFNLYREFQARGLWEAQDFLAATAPDLIRASILSVVKLDVEWIRTIAKEQSNNGRA